jgi:hypothetical protein
MKKTPVEPKYIQEGYLRGCTETTYVELREGEAGLHGKETARTALVGKDQEGRWVCLALDGEKTWSRGYKTIRAAIRNAVKA